MLPLLPRCRHPLRHGTLGQQHLLGALANRSTTVHPASISSKAPLPAASCSVASSGQQQLSHHGAPDSNKPHPAEKSTPVWLVIWCTWAGFANSQSSPMLPHCLPCRVSRGASTLPHRLPLRSIPPLRFACGSSHSRGAWSPTVCAEAFPTPQEIFLHGLQLLRHSKSFNLSVPIAYASSVSPPDEAVEWSRCRC